MALTPEQVKELKRQLSQQIQHLPPEQRQQAQEQIDSMSAEALETMLMQQRAQQGQEQKQQPQKGIFRMIVDGDVPSKKVDENKEAIAVVSVRAVSKGHVLVIPRKAVKDARDLPSQALTLAKKIAKRFSKLGAKGSQIQTSNAFGEVVLNVIPVYDENVGVNSPPYEAQEEELEEVYQKLRIVRKEKKEKIKIRKKSNQEEKALKLSRRIP